VFSHLQEESLKASKWLASVLGEPEWCKGFGIRSTHLVAIAPNLSSAVLAGQTSQGIEPWLANAFMQPTASGEMQRINPEFLKLAESRGKMSKVLIKDILSKKGSVQHLPWLTDHEKLVFKTAFEIDQKVILRLASVRQRYIDQGQSLNLFFSSEEKEEYIREIHEQFLLDPWLKGLYYLRSESGVMASTGECLACSS
jgi:ribonucleoside-diphosphate reductase alpha chain